MNEITNELLLELVLRTLPYPNQISKIDVTSENSAISFTWRGDRFRIGNNLHAGQLIDSCEHGNNISILLSASLKRAYGEYTMEQRR